MNKVLFPKKDYVKELLRFFKSSKNSQKLIKTLSKYHEKDIAEAITLLTPSERQHIYNVLDEHMIAEIFSYLDDTEKYLEELSLEKAARVVSYMDSDDAVDALEACNHDDLVLIQLCIESVCVDVADSCVAVVGMADKARLPAGQRNDREAQCFDRHCQQRERNLLAGGKQHIHLAL